MCCRVLFFLLMFTMFFSAACGENVLTVIDTTNGAAGLQKFFGRVFEKENTVFPQDLEINIAAQSWDEIKNIPPETVLISDSLTAGEVLLNSQKCAYAYKAVVIAVHKDNPLESLDIAALKRIFSGRAGDWSRVGGSVGKIKLAGCDPESGAGRVFRKKVMQQKLQQTAENDITQVIAPDMIICNDAAASEALLQTSEHIIVFGSIELLKNARGKYKILKVENVLPTSENIVSGKYLLAAEYAVIYDKSAPPAALSVLLDFLHRSVVKTPELIPAK